jgi:hypothetical protein
VVTFKRGGRLGKTAICSKSVKSIIEIKHKMDSGVLMFCVLGGWEGEEGYECEI